MGYRRYAPRRRFVKRRPFRRANRVKKMVDGKETTIDKIVRYGSYGVQAIGPIARTVSMLTKLINSESQFVDNNFAPVTSTTGSVTLLSAVAQGDGDQARTGSSSLLSNIMLRIQMYKNASAVSSVVRMILFSDKELDGTAMTIGQILQNASTQSPINKDFSKRLVILKDWYFALDANNVSFTDKYFKQLDFHVNYDGTGATVADCKENHLFLMVLSSEVTNTPTVTVYSRVNYHDN